MSAAAYALRAGLRAITQDRRERLCGTTVVCGEGASIECRGAPGQWKCAFRGVLTCGHIWTCPVCSIRLRSQRLERIEKALRGGAGRWQLVTFTVRHYKGMPLAALMRGLMRAFRRMRQGGETQRTWAARVSASIRATEVTHGPNGWHPHIHVLLRTSEWSDIECHTLFERWRAAVEECLGPDCTPVEGSGIDWAEPFEGDDSTGCARYLTKLGIEIAGMGKAARPPNRNQWQIAEDAVHGDEASRRLWGEYAVAVRGRRMVELDDRAAWWARHSPVVLADSFDESTQAVVCVPLWQEELRALRRLERSRPAVLAEILAEASAAFDPRAVVETFLEVARTEHAKWLAPRLQAVVDSAHGWTHGPPEPSGVRGGDSRATLGAVPTSGVGG